jgi:transcriptional regulator with XRE-family HTH domain
VLTRPTDGSDRRRLGRVLRDFRQRAGLTQERVADLADLSKQYVADVEAGRRNPTLLVLQRVRRALRVTWEELGQALDAAEGGAED